jgi:pilus assembly protein CpaC
MSSLKFRLGANNMQSKSMILARPIALAIGAAMIFGSVAADAAPRKRARAKVVKIVKPRAIPAGVQRPSGELYLSKGRGQLVTLATPITDVFVSNQNAVDVQVQSPTQLYVFGKEDGESSVYATTRTGQVAYSTNVHVSQNVSSLDQMLRLAMPDTDVRATLSGQIAVLTGTVKSPNDIQQAGDLVRAYLNPGIDASDPKAQLKVMVINRIRTATPLQVTLHVRIAEVNRTFSKSIGVNWKNQDSSNGGAVFGISQGRDGGTISSTGGSTNFQFTPNSVGTTLSIGARLLGMNILGALDLGETEGFVSTLATPNLTALTGETATFVAGGEIPIPIAQQSGGATTTSIEYKTYGITLGFTPTVLADGRISLKVKPEVSELDYSNAITIGNARIPGTTNRRVETTVEIGSGQSFVIAGLLRSENSNTFVKTPGAGDVPILGALFRSNGYKRGETELMVVVTPYLVNPVAANKIVLPTDGYKAPTELGRIFGGQLYQGSSSEKRPVPTVAPPTTVPSSRVAPGFSN